MKRILSIALAVFAFVAVSAQEATTNNNLEAKVAELETRIAKNEKRAATLEKVRQYAKLSGFMQGEYDWTYDNENKTGTSSFYLRRVRFSLTGDLYNGKAGKLDYRVYFDLATSSEPIFARLHTTYEKSIKSYFAGEILASNVIGFLYCPNCTPNSFTGWYLIHISRSGLGFGFLIRARSK